MERGLGLGKVVLFAALLGYIIQAVQVEEVDCSSFFPSPISEEGQGVGADVFNLLGIILGDIPADIEGFRIDVHCVDSSAGLRCEAAKGDGAPTVAVSGIRVPGGA